MSDYDDGNERYLDEYPPHRDAEYTDEPYDDGKPPAQPPARLRPAKIEHLPVGDIETKETMTGIVRITRSMQIPGGSRNDVVHMMCELPFPVQPGWAPEKVAQQASDTFYHAKAVVYEQVGVDFTVDEGGVLRETIRHHFPDAQEERSGAAPRRSEQRRDGGSGGGGRRFPHPGDLERPDHVKADQWDDLVNNFDEWYDNRPRKAEGRYKDSAPDFKKSDGSDDAIWLRPMRRNSGGNRRYAN